MGYRKDQRVALYHPTDGRKRLKGLIVGFRDKDGKTEYLINLDTRLKPAWFPESRVAGLTNMRKQKRHTEYTVVSLTPEALESLRRMAAMFKAHVGLRISISDAIHMAELIANETADFDRFARKVGIGS